MFRGLRFGAINIPSRLRLAPKPLDLEHHCTMEPARIWISDADCRLEDFRRLVERHARLADYPLASAVHHNVLTYQGDDIRRAAPDPERRKALMAEWARALNDGPGILLFEDAFADLAVVDAATDSFLRHDRGAARQQRQRRRSFRQARRQRPHLERAGKALPARSAAVRALLRQRSGRAGVRSVARPLLSDHLADQRRQSRRRGAVAASRLSSSGSRRRRCSRASPRMPIGCRPC